MKPDSNDEDAVNTQGWQRGDGCTDGIRKTSQEKSIALYWVWCSCPAGARTNLFSVMPVCHVLLCGRPSRPHYGSCLSVRLSWRDPNSKTKKASKNLCGRSPWQESPVECQFLFGLYCGWVRGASEWSIAKFSCFSDRVFTTSHFFSNIWTGRLFPNHSYKACTPESKTGTNIRTIYSEFQ